ncbi:class I SAM-dependent methyltransferase [Nocardioides baekrokdamisoli]|nr:class I SAM-dependent methyltransferase [Nocardioides baekrokdamisoli]
MSDTLLALASATKGFMPDDEGQALYEYALARAAHGPIVEIGTYCGKSAIYLGAAAQLADSTVFTVDHHRGSEENQAGWEHHDDSLVDPTTGLMDTLANFRRTMQVAQLEGTVVPIVGDSPVVARHWRTPISMLFIDGGHGVEPARQDYLSWAPWVAVGGLLAIHDVFPDPADGGRPPYEEIYLPALASGQYEEIEDVGSLRLLRRTSGEPGSL